MNDKDDKVEALLQKYNIPNPRCGAYVGDGWVPLVDQLFADMIALGWDRDLHQLKEKFGGLRVYIGVSSASVKERIRVAEEVAARTCDECGAPGEILESPRGWWTCWCKGCYAKSLTKYIEECKVDLAETLVSIEKNKKTISDAFWSSTISAVITGDQADLTSLEKAQKNLSRDTSCAQEMQKDIDACEKYLKEIQPDE